MEITSNQSKATNNALSPSSSEQPSSFSLPYAPSSLCSKKCESCFFFSLLCSFWTWLMGLFCPTKTEANQAHFSRLMERWAYFCKDALNSTKEEYNFSKECPLAIVIKVGDKIIGYHSERVDFISNKKDFFLTSFFERASQKIKAGLASYQPLSSNDEFRIWMGLWEKGVSHKGFFLLKTYQLRDGEDIGESKETLSFESFSTLINSIQDICKGSKENQSFEKALSQFFSKDPNNNNQLK